ncbi:unnamed protein product, partial [Amoebophrya sp. A120]|eukprot:GSA120T00001553001.1
MRTRTSHGGVQRTCSIENCRQMTSLRNRPKKMEATTEGVACTGTTTYSRRPSFFLGNKKTTSTKELNLQEDKQDEAEPALPLPPCPLSDSSEDDDFGDLRQMKIRKDVAGVQRCDSNLVCHYDPDTAYEEAKKNEEALDLPCFSIESSGDEVDPSCRETTLKK